MILKEVDEKSNLHEYEQYGYEAENLMAFYLKCEFQHVPDVYVINDIRLEMRDQIVHIGHLIIHRYGFIIIESKSITSKIAVDEKGEWTRHFLNQSKKIPSPLKQAEKQAELLRSFLVERSEDLLINRFVLKTAMSNFKFNPLIAISENGGSIDMVETEEINEIYLANKIAKVANEIIDNYASSNKVDLNLKTNYQFADSTLHRITQCLLKVHTAEPQKPPVVEKPKKKQRQQKPAVAQNASNHQACGECRSSAIEVKSGRYGYYIECNDCHAHTPLKLDCPKDSKNCHCRIRAEENKLYQVCSSCNTSVLFFENKPQEIA